jgi:hypothetical protein
LAYYNNSLANNDDPCYRILKNKNKGRNNRMNTAQQQRLKAVFDPSINLISPPSDLSSDMTFPMVARRYLMTEPDRSSPEDMQRTESIFLSVMASWIKDAEGCDKVLGDIHEEIEAQGYAFKAHRRYKWLEKLQNGLADSLPCDTRRDELMFLAVCIYDKEYDMGLTPHLIARKGKLSTTDDATDCAPSSVASEPPLEVSPKMADMCFENS